MSDGATISTDVACTVCGCVCDDLELHVEDGRIKNIRGSCQLSEPWFYALNDCRPHACLIEGAPSTQQEALHRASTILQTSRNPLIFGLSRSSTQGQRAAVQLAEELRANIDTTASVCHGPSILAIQQAGESTCSLGEIRNRADLVIFWGANPAESHPRHFERYSVDAIGQFIPRGRADRTIVVVDTKPTATSESADIFLQVKPQRDFELFWIIRQLLRGDSPATPVDTGIPLDRIRDLAERMKSCRYGAVFFGLGLAQRGLGHLTVDALLRLVADLNSHTRFVARRLRLPGDVTGADSVMCWQTGYPFAVNFARGYPRYNPGEFSADNLLSKQDVDACLLVGSECVAMLSQAARDALCQIPTVVLDYPHIEATWQPTVRFTTSVYGVHLPGTAYRMDETPIPLRPVMDSHYPSDDDLLTAITKRVAANYLLPADNAG